MITLGRDCLHQVVGMRLEKGWVIDFRSSKGRLEQIARVLPGLAIRGEDAFSHDRYQSLFPVVIDVIVFEFGRQDAFEIFRFYCGNGWWTQPGRETNGVGLQVEKALGGRRQESVSSVVFVDCP